MGVRQSPQARAPARYRGGTPRPVRSWRIAGHCRRWSVRIAAGASGYTGPGLQGYDMANEPPTLPSAAETPTMVAAWVAEVTALTQPEQIHWCDGSESEARRLRDELTGRGELLELHPGHFPGCFLYRSAPTDVARVEHLTYICTESQEEAGPNNNWMAPTAAHAKIRELFRGCIRGRTLHVAAHYMGPIASS